MNIAGILRNKVFSPNSNDDSIMEFVANGLRANGHQVTFYKEETLPQSDINEHIIFSMARGSDSLLKLQQCENCGAIVVTSPKGVQNCERISITRLMFDIGINIPPSVILYLSDGLEIPDDIAFPCWLKCAGTCTQQKEDVCFIEDWETLELHIGEFRHRGIKTALLSQHVTGDIIKFYSVTDTDFFYWYYPTQGPSHSKFGLEKHNGMPRQYPFSIKKLKQDTDKIARLAEVPVYGGDCIVDETGKYWIIDFNDWPSFSPCIEDASKAIVKYIINQISYHVKY